MPQPTGSLRASAQFDIRPARSQVVLVAIAVAAIVNFVIGGVLLGLDKPGWPFVFIATALCASVVWCWRQSHRDTDLDTAHPTTVVLADGSNLSTDSRLLSSPDGVRSLARVVEALALRQPLPEPAGLTGPGAVPIPDSRSEAVARVTDINADTQKAHDQAIAQLRGHLTRDTGMQVPTEPGHAPEALSTPHTSPNGPLQEASERTY